MIKIKSVLIEISNGNLHVAYKKVIILIQSQVDDLLKAIESELAITQKLSNIQKISNKLSDINNALEKHQEVSRENPGLARTKHVLLVLTKLFQDTIVDIVKDTLAELVKQNISISAGLVTRLANFVIDYGYESSRFFVSWNYAHQLLYEQENREYKQRTLREKIKLLTDQSKTLRSEIRQLENSQGNEESILYELRQKDLKQAYFDGDWFSQKFGIISRGNPIRTELD